MANRRKDGKEPIHAGGRPPKYKETNEELEKLEKLIDEYFDECDGKPLLDEDGKAICDKYGYPIIVGKRPPTVTGLALKLGFDSRTSLLNYQHRSKKFNRVISRAKLRLEMYTEERLFDKDGANGAKFSLQNNFKDWNDTKTIAGNENASPVKIICDIPLTNPAAAKPPTQPEQQTTDAGSTE